MKKAILLGALFSFGFSFAQEDLESLKRQLEEQRRIIQELQRKIEALEKQKVQKVEQTAEEKPKPPPSDRSLQLRLKYDEKRQAYGIFRQPSFLPNISLIVDTSVVSRNMSDDDYSNRSIPEFFDGDPTHGHGLNKNKGFNLNYAELYFYAPVDPYFDLYATIPFTEDGAELEEAYFTTRSLPFGFQIKGGKFRSSFGRFNQKHPHAWDFAKAPLIYEALFGEEGLTEKGVQISWFAPTPFYLLFGAEVLQGENERSFGYKGFEIGNAKVEDAKVPNLYVGFVKTSFDLGSLSVLTGLSYAQGKHRHAGGDHGLSAKSKIYGFELTGKYLIDSYRYISFEGEYLYRKQDGTEYETNTSEDITKKQSGFYTQLVFKFDRRWRAGIRYDLINQNKVNGEKKTPNLPAYYAMLEYSPTEFSFIRLQAGQNRAYYVNGERKKVNEVILQLNFAIGAHGAHPF